MFSRKKLLTSAVLVTAMSIAGAASANATANTIAAATQSKTTATAQSTSGRITDSNGQPLVGVTVMVKGTQKGTMTDPDGNFSLANVAPGSQLTFRYVGYKDVTANAGSGMNIVLQEDNQLLDEIVVVGYGYMQRKDVTSSTGV